MYLLRLLNKTRGKGHALLLRYYIKRDNIRSDCDIFIAFVF